MSCENNESKQLKMYHNWEDYNLDEDLVRGIYNMGFETPSHIQKVAIKPIIDGKDIRAQAQSGTGKTGAFAIGSLQCVDRNLPCTQVLVIVSTREIAAQNASRFKEISMYMGINVCLLSGGSSVSQDINNLNINPHVVVGTPGRVDQMIQQNHLKTDKIKLFVIDEADEMLQSGFQEQVKSIFKSLNRNSVQIAMFSATYEEEELRVSEEVLKDPVVIDLRQDNQTLAGIQQFYINLGKDESPRKDDYSVKCSTLVDLLKNYSFGQTVIFVTSKIKANFVYNGLMQHEIPCELISSDLTQSQRVEVLDRFRSGANRILISSGLLSRGVDIQNLSVVFCLDVPSEDKKSTYIHRIGRSGRYGKKGFAINILHEHEFLNLTKIEKFYNTKIVQLAHYHLEQFKLNKE
ncbi:ATP-dependent RNA helicase eIF4A (TIF1) [Vairimorpha necatrix]|uniref:RNA helicase n=1 Tax=Vairimorpha necatrix TaxID=6039 RepID=A0AAX4JEW6_9MICR